MPVRLPLALRVVALIFLLNGIGSAITIILSILSHGFQLDFGVIGIFVYFGLMRLSRGWRKCAIVLLWIGLLLIPVIGVLSLGVAHANISFFGIRGPAIPTIFVFFFAVLWFGLAWWQLKVLNRPAIVALFAEKELSRPS